MQMLADVCIVCNNSTVKEVALFCTGFASIEQSRTTFYASLLHLVVKLLSEKVLTYKLKHFSAT